MRMETVWTLSGTLNGLMAVPNLIALFPLSGEVARIARHIGQKPRGKSVQPVLY